MPVSKVSLVPPLLLLALSSCSETTLSPAIIDGPLARIRMTIDSLRSPAAGDQHSCAININHPIATGWETICWGQNVGTTSDLLVPTPIAGDPGFYLVEAGTNLTCALVSSSLPNNAYCWGVDTWGQLGNGPGVEPQALPVHVAGNIRFVEISAGGTHACGIDANSDAWCWGLNTSGQLGNGTQASSHVPVRVGGGLKFFGITTGNQHSCASRSNPALQRTEIYCWGLGVSGQLGTGNTLNQSLPTMTRFPTGITSWNGVPKAGYNHTCASKGAGIPGQYFHFYCWGHNSFGQLGDGTRTDRSTPVRVLGPVTNWFKEIIRLGNYHTCALDGNSPYCWGANDNGQVGIGTTSSFVLLPTRVAGGINVLKSLFAVGGYHAWGASASNSWAWGRGTAGQLGNGQTLNQPTPVAF